MEVGVASWPSGAAGLRLVQLVPCRSDITAKEFAEIFFDRWYCENGLPKDIISDRDRLFTSAFWQHLHKLSGVKLKLSTVFHPQTDGLSERTNKTVVQMLRYHVDRAQSGWVKALPRVRFHIMNSVNASTGYSPFQLKSGRSPRVIPLIGERETSPPHSELSAAHSILREIELDNLDAQDNLIIAKVSQAIQADKHRQPDPQFQVGQFVMLNTLNRRKQFMHTGDGRVAKFMPRWSGKYKITQAWPSSSTYKILIPDQPNAYSVFHASELKPYHENDPILFPSRQHDEPPPVTINGQEEFIVDRIIDQRRRGRGFQYLVRWLNYGPEHDLWIPRRQLENCVALDIWQQKNP